MFKVIEKEPQLHEVLSDQIVLGTSCSSVNIYLQKPSVRIHTTNRNSEAIYAVSWSVEKSLLSKIQQKQDGGNCYWICVFFVSQGNTVGKGTCQFRLCVFFTQVFKNGSCQCCICSCLHPITVHLDQLKFIFF